MIAALALVGAAFADVPGVVVETYPVTGDDVAAIRDSLRARGPRDPHDGARVAALTNWRFRWRWPGTRHDCRLGEATVSFAATVTLPELAGTDALPPEVQASWRRYRAALEAHEANHVRYAYQHRDEVLAAIQGATCATAQGAGKRVLARLVEHDLAYDRDTRHGESEGAEFP